MRAEDIERALIGRCEAFYPAVICEQSVGSTNEEAKKLAREGAAGGVVFLAEEQTAGKGRNGRVWKSPAGENLYFSVILRLGMPAAKQSAATLVMGLSAAQAIRKTTGLPALIKWPNDIVVNGKKVCGILCEYMAEAGAADGALIVGCGINVNQTVFDPEIADRATSVCREMSAGDENTPPGPVSRTALLAEVLTAFAKNMTLFTLMEDLEPVREDYEELLVNRGQTVRVEDPAGAYTAEAAGISEDGALLVIRDGRTERITSGEVSVRGLYGYV